ncbi:DEAD/DEAH box helicase [Streptococcus sp. CSL10205-OR2]|uniref:DEAD/DEAH box helicase n=1 Tax=Streptococcus sp. CSL10205-OR2 TaxID=2980558 RepID=UPI0021DAAFC0|nr:DEAD/DEAH box helicase [Streptococcus sp. CSL10205-OR2]MCU9533502.1 DEAD/DEAH box helicase [Streptococcus sp. CSL10205-OR2]
MTNLDDYYGRLFTQNTLPEIVKGHVKSMPAMTKKNGVYYCQRCASTVEQEAYLPNGDYYCRDCLVFGRISSSEKLYYLPQKSFPKKDYLDWQGKLTDLQAEVSQKLLVAMKEKENSLVHAVTGAGKTEMIYPIVSSSLKKGQSIALVSPRIDVCRELHHRFSRDFTCSISLLHNGSKPYQRSPLIVATVHQLFKFYHAFDLIIIDEVDAFPFVDNRSLYQAVTNALKKDGLTIFLTATSTEKLDKEVAQKRLQKVDLARRFHANPLVVPKPFWLSQLRESIVKGKLPRKLQQKIKQQAKTRYPLLLFIPDITLGKQLLEVMTSYFSDENIAFVTSLSEDRLEIVESFRQGKLRILITTTILERGVTFPCVDVFVLLANHKLYSKSSLVQIAGRVGRSSERPTGELLFFHDGLNINIKKAIKEIKIMNQKGGF